MVLANMAPQNKTNTNMLNLPDELLLEIIAWIPYDALVSTFWNVASASTRLRRIVTDGTLPMRIIQNQYNIYLLLGCAPIAKNTSDWNNVKLLWSLWQSEEGFEQLFETDTAKRAGMMAVALLHTIQNASFPTRCSSPVDQRHNTEERLRILYLNLVRILQALPPQALLLLRWLFNVVSKEPDIDDMVEHIPMDWRVALFPAIPWTVTYCFRCMFPMQILTMHSGFSHLIEPFDTMAERLHNRLKDANACGTYLRSVAFNSSMMTRFYRTYIPAQLMFDQMIKSIPEIQENVLKKLVWNDDTIEQCPRYRLAGLPNVSAPHIDQATKKLLRELESFEACSAYITRLFENESDTKSLIESLNLKKVGMSIAGVCTESSALTSSEIEDKIDAEYGKLNFDEMGIRKEKPIA